MYEFILQNKEFFKVFYAIIIATICTFIVLRTDKLFHLSFHNGIRYFRNAFFFYGIAFLVRFIFGAQIIYNFIGTNYVGLINFIFEFFIIMAGFFLLYSLLWKKIEKKKEEYYSSLFNKKIFVFYVMAVIIATLDFLWQSHSLMFFSQVAIFFIAMIISYGNYLKKGKKHRFLKFYFFAMLLSFLAWLANTLAAFYFQWNKAILLGVYLSNAIIFLLFLYGVIRVTGNKRIVSLPKK